MAANRKIREKGEDSDENKKAFIRRLTFGLAQF